MQSLKGQCPNAFGILFGAASLTEMHIEIFENMKPASLTEMHIEIFENVKPGEIRVAGGKILRSLSPCSQVF